ncbi:hypothetical protein [Streptosporangium sp. NPDC002607]
MTEVPRVSTDARRDREAARCFAQMIEHLGRTITAIEAGRWDSARNHLYLVREASAVCDVTLNTGQPDPRTFLDAVRAQVPQEWADAIRTALGGASCDA